MVCAWDPSPGEMETERVLRSLANWLNLIGKFQTTSERLFQTRRHTYTCVHAHRGGTGKKKTGKRKRRRRKRRKKMKKKK